MVIFLGLAISLLFLVGLSSNETSRLEGGQNGMACFEDITIYPMINSQTLLPENPIPRYRVLFVSRAIVTGYSSTLEETDDTPTITANGERVREGIIACNWLRFGTMVEINGKYYEVTDRMNPKYNDRVDIWFPTKEQAKSFGKKFLTIKIVR